MLFILYYIKELEILNYREESTLDLKDIREEIDKIDSSIVEEFENRMAVCKQVANYKISNGKNVLDREREIQKIQKVKEQAKSWFNQQAIEELFTQIMAISRKLQYQLLAENGLGPDIKFQEIQNIEKENVNVVYQGVEGAYSHEAMMNYFGGTANDYNVQTFREVMEAVKGGEADYGVLPIENSTAGIVNEVYDLLVEYDNYIVDQIDVSVKHALLGLKEANMEDIRVVYSHPQGLMQCADFLEVHKDWQQIAQPNTAGSAKKVVEENLISQAAIASVNAGNIYGLKILKEEINENSQNTTRFIIISNKKVYTANSKKVSVCFTLPHESGTLYNMLSHFIYNGLNMTKIESRPIKNKSWEYRFFIEFEGRLNMPGTLNALRGIIEEANSFKILGSY